MSANTLSFQSLWALCCGLFFFTCTNTQIQAQCNSVSESDSLALVEFYNALNGSNWTNNDGWLTAPVETWRGISLDENCEVQEINLSYNNLHGNIPDINLPSLKFLKLHHLPITGTIPNFSNLPNLEILHLYNSELEGPIPNLENCPNLKEINFCNNQLTGQLSDYAYWPNLEKLRLTNNNITGSIPDFSNLGNLKVLEIAHAELEGTIPNFSNLPNLEIVQFSNNNLVGSIPSFSNTPNIQRLNLGSNQLTGGIPDPSAFQHIIMIGLSNNQLTGSIPDFSGLQNILQIFLVNNQLTGNIPNFNLPLLRELGLEENQLTGNIPNFNLPTLTYLNLNLNQLSGQMPSLNNCPSLHYLHLAENLLTGTIPNLDNCPELVSLRLQNNSLTGPVPNLDNCPILKYLFLSNNSLTGTIPNFNNCPQLHHLHLSNNALVGTIPNLNNFSELISVAFDNNLLSGSMPSFQNFPELTSIALDNNALTGSVPNFINCPKLLSLSICPNNFVGSIPLFENCLTINNNSYDFSCIDGAKITGFAYHDANGNCQKDADEAGIPNVLITTHDAPLSTPNNNYFETFTNEDGFYELQTDVATHYFSTELPNILTNTWKAACLEDFYTVTVADINDSIPNYNFALTAITENCPLLEVTIGTPLLRRCFSNQYTIDYCNYGTTLAQNAYIEVSLPESVIPTNSSIPYMLNADNNLIFEIGNIAIGACNRILLTDSISCDAELGSTACIKASIFPNDYCFPSDSAWDGSDIFIDANCLGNEVQFTIENKGDAMAVNRTYAVYQDDELYRLETYNLAAGASINLNYAATGQTYRLTATQDAVHPFNHAATKAIEACGISPYSYGFINSQFNEDSSPFYDEDCLEIIGSFDPNDKAVFPKGIKEGHYINENDLLQYRIRFQNTGNDTAFQVIVVDTINTEILDINSLKILSSSHDYEFTLKSGNVLSFIFSNILLPDSTTNEMASHGYIDFSIAQKSSSDNIGELLENSAAIYFDYNLPVITNTVYNTIGIPKRFPIIPTTIATQGEVISPFTAKIVLQYNKLHIQLSNNHYPSITDCQFELYNLWGQKIRSQKLSGNGSWALTVPNLASGTYLYNIVTANRERCSGKVMIGT